MRARTMLSSLRHTVAVLSGNGHDEAPQPLLGKHIKEVVECIKNVKEKRQQTNSARA